MAKIKLANGIEITLDTREVVELIREYGSIETPDLMIKMKPLQDHVSPQLAEKKSGIDMVQRSESNFPTIFELIEAVEIKGRPFSFNVTEDLFQRFGVRPRQDRYHYNKLRKAYEIVKEKMSDKYKGHWTEKKEDINGRSTIRFILVEKADQ